MLLAPAFLINLLFEHPNLSASGYSNLETSYFHLGYLAMPAHKSDIQIMLAIKNNNLKVIHLQKDVSQSLSSLSSQTSFNSLLSRMLCIVFYLN